MAVIRRHHLRAATQDADSRKRSGRALARLGVCICRLSAAPVVAHQALSRRPGCDPSLTWRRVLAPGRFGQRGRLVHRL